MAFEQVDIGFAFINAQSNIVINYCKQWAILKIYARLFARRLLRSLMCNCYIFVSCLALTALLRFEKTSEKRWRKKKEKTTPMLINYLCMRRHAQARVFDGSDLWWGKTRCLTTIYRHIYLHMNRETHVSRYLSIIVVKNVHGLCSAKLMFFLLLFVISLVILIVNLFTNKN